MRNNKFESESKFTFSLGLSLIIHAIVFSFLIINISSKKITSPIMVNLLKNADPNKKIIKAGFVDKNAIAQAQRRIVEQQQKAEQLKQEAEKSAQVEIAKKIAEQKALELSSKLAAKKIAEDKANLEKQRVAKEQIAKQQHAKQQQAKQKAIKDAELKQVAERQSAAIKAQKDRLAAEHNALLATELEKFKAELTASIIENKIVSSMFSKDITCELRIRLLPDGSILSIDVAKPSGNPAYDEMQISAVSKAAPFSMPEDHELYSQLREIVLSLSNDMESTDA